MVETNREPRSRTTAGTRRGCLVAIALVVGFLLLALLAPRIGTIAGGEGVGVVRLTGEILDSGEVLEDLEKLADDPAVRALVVRIDSPGGVVGASQEIYSGIKRTSEETGKPIVASFGDVAASGAYYAACAADSVFANAGTLTGSIGVIMELPDIGRVLEKIGVRVQVVKSGAFKDMGSPYRDMTKEERQLLQGVIDDTYEQFVDAVATGRRIPRAKVLAIADGRVLTGRQALALGLVDRLGDLEDAVRTAGRMADIEGEPRQIHRKHHRWPWDTLEERWVGVERRALTGPRLLYRIP
jgi:protease-4